ncbi:MAG: 2-oxo acid dehydrogenase subunit E2, partial [Verrucomicrobia bacterium]|nr:2-oxo acid dehydrogenase subunit E2 [Verrucomicrobiota bacterium]
TASETEGGDDAEEVSKSADGGRIFVSPLAKRMARDLKVDLSLVKGTGPNGRIVKADVEHAAKNPPAPASKVAASGSVAGVAFAETKTLPVTNMRAAISRALVASKTEAPHFYLQTEVDGAPLDKLRKQLNTHLADLPAEQGGVKLSVNDLILKAAAMAVLRVPAINRAWQGDKIVEHGTVHLAFGVAIDDGLVTPVIRDAQSKSLRVISSEAKDLIGKARGKKLKPAEMSGSTLTVTNLGMFGITDFYGIINPPNAAILSVGATVKTPVVDDKGQITVGYRMKVGLSGDHRVIDGAVGAQYLAALREILETPALMLV